MATSTSALPDALLQKLAQKAEALLLPKNKIMEQALRLYLEHLDKAEYIKSYQVADKDVLALADEGMADCLSQLPDETR